MNISKFYGLFVAIAVLVVAPSSFAEDATSGILSSKVVSQSGGSISGAAVSIQSTSTGVSRSGVSDSSGSVDFPLLAVGSYTVTVSASGYETLSDTISITLGGTSSYRFVLGSGTMEEMLVTAGARAVRDFDTTTTGIVVDVDKLINTTPINRDLTAVALLAPGTQAGDSAFGYLASIGGSSVAENVYIVNGLNLTNFRNFTGASSVPFEFYEQVEVKTGGYQAEFGKAIGGVINAVTKSGSNDFEFGFNISHYPDSWYEDKPNTYSSLNNLDERDLTEINVWASGPIIRDKLFYYLLVNPEENEYLDTGLTQQSAFKTDETFFGAKLDYYVNDKIHLEYTYFTDDAENVDTLYNYNQVTGDTSLVGPSLISQGGDNQIIKASFLIGDNFTAAVTWGRNEYDRTISSPTDSNPACYLHSSLTASGGWEACGSFSNFSISVGDDEREITRLDLDWYLGKHHIRLGYEEEELIAVDKTINSGGAYYMYGAVPAYSGYMDPQSSTGYFVRHRLYESGGTFTTDQEVLYFQDSWQASDQLQINLGIRRSSYDNKNANGLTFVSVEDQDALRLGATYDIDGDGNRKIFGSYGEYYLPIAANTNIRMAGGETYIHTFYEVTADQVGSSSPTYGTQLGQVVYGDGQVQDTRSLTDTNIEPMYSEEFIVGYAQTLEGKFLNGFDIGISYTHRSLASTIEDVAIDAAVIAYCANNGITATDGSDCADVWSGFHQYVLTNPGSDMNVYLPELGETVTLTSAALKYPVVDRTYDAWVLQIEKPFDGDWGLNASWTWSQTKGNYEGTVKSDNGQDDAGITQDFDQPGLTDGSYGYLPNHREHLLKVFGTVQLTDTLVGGMSLKVESPRLFGCIGTHPTDDFAAEYGDSSWYCDSKLTPRASQAESDWIQTVDAMLLWHPNTKAGDLTIKLDVFNIFDASNVIDINEYGESGGPLNPNPHYQKATNYQLGRRARIGFEWKF